MAIPIAAGAGLVFAYSGVYDVAASKPHTGLVEWTLETITRQSVGRRADELPAPLPGDEASLLHGLEHYRAMCEVCHGAPGIERSEIGQGMTPRPPLLQRAAVRWTDAELFWIVKHGLKATGMPAFGATHDDASLLQIVAVVRRLPDATPEEYAAMIAELEASGMAPHNDAAVPPADGAAGAALPHEDADGMPPHAH